MRPAPRRDGLWALLGSASAHALFLVGTAVAPVTLAEDAPPPLDHGAVDSPIMMMVTVRAVPEPVEALDPWPVPQPPSQAHEGHLDRPDRAARYGIYGPPDNPDPHLSRALTENDSVVLSGVGGLPTSYGSPGPTAPWGRDESLGTDPRNARGRMFGGELDDAWGRGELAGHPSLTTAGFT